MTEFEVSAVLNYEVEEPSTLVLSIQPVHYGKQLILEENLHTEGKVIVKELVAPNGRKRYTILDIPEKGTVHISYRAIVQSHIIRVPKNALLKVPIAQLSSDILDYLHPSRYCQSDRLYKFASHHFGHLQGPFDQVIAIRDWIYMHIEYRSGYTNSQTSAMDTITELVGVCRDFAHVGIALCRALDIPARYFSAYAYQLEPPDFHACFEVYIGGYWIIVDATKLAPLNGLIRIATGADATETATASIFGQVNLLSMEVKTQLLNAAPTTLDGDSHHTAYALL